MSSVSDSTSSRDDTVRRQQEEFNQRESKTIRKHNKRLRQIAESHTKELDLVKQKFENQIDNIKAQSRDNMTRRDQQYSKDIGAINKIHNKRLEQIATAADQKISTLKTSVKQEKDFAQRRVDQRVDSSETQKHNALEQQAKQFKNFVDDMRNKQDQALKAQRTDMMKNQEKQFKSLRDQRSREVGSLERSLRETRSVAEIKARDTHSSNFRNLNRLAKTNMKTILAERKLAATAQKDIRAGFQDSLAELKQEQRDNLIQGRSGGSGRFEDFKISIEAKIAKRMDAADDKVFELKEKHDFKQKAKESLQKKELKNIRKSYARSQKELERTIQQLKNANNDENNKNIHDINFKTKTLVKATNRNVRRQINTMSSISKQAFKEISDDYNTRVKNLNEQKDVSAHRLKTNYDAKELNLKETYKDTVADLKESQLLKIDKIRNKVTSEKHKSIQILKEKVNSEIVKFGRREADLRNKFEDRLKLVNRNHLKSKKMAEKHNIRIQSEIRDTQQNDIDGLKVKFKESMIETNGRHKDEIHRLNRAHASQMDKLINTLKKT